MDIRKIRYDGTKVDIQLMRPNKEDTDAVSFSSTDEPRAAFKRALANLRGDFRYFLEMPAEMEGKLVLYGIVIAMRGSAKTFKFIGGLQLGCGFTSLNSPTLYEATDEMKEGDAILTKDQRARLQSLIARSEEYYLGGRTQPDIFDPVEASTEAGEGGQDVEEEAEATEVAAAN